MRIKTTDWNKINLALIDEIATSKNHPIIIKDSHVLELMIMPSAELLSRQFVKPELTPAQVYIA